MVKLPLLELFYRLREPLSLQIDQYHLLMEALEQGFGCAGVEDLRNTCRLLWLKVHHGWEVEIFEQLFSEFIEQYIAPPQETTPENQELESKTIESESQQQTASEIESKTIPQPKPKPSLNQPASKKPIVPPKAPPKVTTAFQKPSNTEPIKRGGRGGKYIVEPSDFPFEERPIRHSWRKLNRPLRAGRQAEIDVNATIDRAVKQGFLINPVWRKARVNQMEIVFLEDREGSMVPFRPVIDELFQTIEPEKFQAVYRYYFRNCPGDFVYCQPKGTDVVYLEELPLRGTQTVVVIVSDAGAMRGGLNDQRIKDTEKFLDEIFPRVSGLAWINPLPPERWQGTTAAAIEQQLLPGRMFELPMGGIQQAVRAVQGGRV